MAFLSGLRLQTADLGSLLIDPCRTFDDGMGASLLSHSIPFYLDRPLFLAQTESVAVM